MKIKQLLNEAIKILNENQIEDGSIKARLLLQHILKQDKNYLIVNCDKEVDKKVEEIYIKYVQQIVQGKPLQYITKAQEFMGLDFYVDENVLIPQPDTEILVEESIKEIKKRIKYIVKNGETENEQNAIQADKAELQEKNTTIRILDMCTGSGAIAISIAKYLKENCKNTQNIQLNKEGKKLQFEVYGVDISEEALKIAGKNANTNQVDVTFFKSNMFEQVKKHVVEPFDIIVSNPPYIETDIIETLAEEVKQEPYIALDGGKDGLRFYRIIAQEGKNYLKENGSILLEIGYNQKESVTKLLKEMNEYSEITCIQDLSGNDRVVKGNIIRK